MKQVDPLNDLIAGNRDDKRQEGLKQGDGGNGRREKLGRVDRDTESVVSGAYDRAGRAVGDADYGHALLAGNGDGCNDMEEVADACGITGVGELDGDNRELEINVFPNPTNDIYNLQFTIYGLQRITLGIYDLQGRLITTVVDEVMAAGEYVLRFDARHLPVGIYFLRQSAIGNRQLATEKLIKY